MERIRSLGYMDLIWEDTSKALISQWVGGAINRDLRAGLEAALEEFKKRPAGAQWIGDTTHIGIIGDVDQQWINTDWFPRFLGTGVKFMAVVQPASIVAKLAVGNIVSKVEGTSLTVFNCSSLKDAIEWMKGVNK